VGGFLERHERRVRHVVNRLEHDRHSDRKEKHGHQGLELLGRRRHEDPYRERRALHAPDATPDPLPRPSGSSCCPRRRRSGNEHGVKGYGSRPERSGRGDSSRRDKLGNVDDALSHCGAP